MATARTPALRMAARRSGCIIASVVTATGKLGRRDPLSALQQELLHKVAVKEKPATCSNARKLACGGRFAHPRWVDPESPRQLTYGEKLVSMHAPTGNIRWGSASLHSIGT